MSIEWFDKKAGSDIGVSKDDPRMLLVGVGEPDWVQLPGDLGGGTKRCLGVFLERCPCVGHDHECLHYAIEGTIWCAECAESGQFLWYRKPGC